METVRKESHPKGFWYVFWAELAERSSFYGMKALLAMYLTSVIGYSDDVAGPVNNVFTAFCYLLPLLGGFVAERYIGRFKTIVYFAIPYIAGHLILGGFDSKVGLFAALVLLACGSGAIKPNVSPLMGMMYDQQGKSRELRSKAFTWFYSAINIGAASSMMTLPIVRDHYGYGVAFMFPTILMVISLGIFYFGKKEYPTERLRRDLPKRTDEQKKSDRMVIKNLSGIFLLVVFFWMIYDQSSNTWVYFARDYLELNGVAPDMIQGLNPILIVAMSPMFAFLWSWLKKRHGWEATYTQKMMFGFGLVVICMVTMGIAGWLATNGGGKISIWWEIAAFVIITMAELCVSVVCLEMAYSEAPEHLKSTMTALFLLTVFVGDLLAGLMSAIYPHMNPGAYFMSSAGLMVVITAVFYFVGKSFEQRKAETEANA